MSQQSINLKEVERRAFRSTFQDGLWDIYLGMIFLGFALMPALEAVLTSESARILAHLGYVLIALVLMWLGKRYITAPRLGQATFGPARKRRLMRGRWLLTASFVLGVVLFLLFASGNGIGLNAVLLLFTVNILVVLGALAYFLDYSRLYGYAVLWAFSLPLGELLERSAGLGDAAYVFFVTAGLSVVIGLVLLVRFMQDYPLPAGDGSDGR